MIKNFLIISILVFFMISTIFIIFMQGNGHAGLSEYKLRDIEEYKLPNKSRDMQGMVTTDDGSTVSVQMLADDSYDVLYTSMGEPIGIYKALVSEKLLGVYFFPSNDIIYIW